jgi:hypothetical protein
MIVTYDRRNIFIVQATDEIVIISLTFFIVRFNSSMRKDIEDKKKFHPLFTTCG